MVHDREGRAASATAGRGLRVTVLAPDPAVTGDAPDLIIRCIMTPDRAIDDFLGDCRARGWSERTISTYAATLYRFADRLPVDQDVSKVTVDDIRRYRATRQRR